MAKVRYLVRFYSSHDLDLVTFTLTHDFDIMRAMYSAVTAFSKGESFIIEVPPATGTLPESLRRSYSRALSLDTEKDAEAIRMLDMVVPGKRNSFLKNLLRIYLMFPFSESFFESPEGFALCEKRLESCRKGRRAVRAGKTGPPGGTSGKREGKPVPAARKSPAPAPEPQGRGQDSPSPDPHAGTMPQEASRPAAGTPYPVQEDPYPSQEGSADNTDAIQSIFDSL